MCKDCGCEEGLKLKRHKHDHDHDHKHEHKHDHHHDHHHDHGRRIILEKNVLAHNDEIAHNNKHWFEDHNMKVINIISSLVQEKRHFLKKQSSSSKRKSSFPF